MDKQGFLAQIAANVSAYGYHLTAVTSLPNPRWAYTIGLTHRYGFELVFAGGSNYLHADMVLIIEGIVKSLAAGASMGDAIPVAGLGSFSLSPADSSWCSHMLLGVYDYYQTAAATACQIVPEVDKMAIDVPNMSIAWDAAIQPIWRWLNEEWQLPVPKMATVVTDMDALLGYAITEVARWEEDEWEMYSEDPRQIAKEDVRVMPIGTMIGFDTTLSIALTLPIGKGI